jgi:hypothetical protein
MCILVIYVRAQHCCVVVLQLDVMPQGLLFLPQLVGYWLPLCVQETQACSDCTPLIYVGRHYAAYAACKWRVGMMGR